MKAAALVAVREAPAAPGVYLFLGPDRQLLYIGKAGDLRRRLHQHAGGRAGGRVMVALYAQVADVKWQVMATEADAATREADLIVALRPPFNASYRDDGRWAYVVVGAAGGERLAFRLAQQPQASGGRAYGCFPHLGRGVSSPPAIACSEGYAALLRMLWAAGGDAGRMPARVGGPSPPDAFETAVAPPLRASLHAFMTGTSPRLLDGLAAAAARREAFMQPGLRRDRDKATSFFTAGPEALRRLRLRHRRRPGPLGREGITELLATEVRAIVGDFQVQPRPDAATLQVGRRMSRLRAASPPAG